MSWESEARELMYAGETAAAIKLIQEQGHVSKEGAERLLDSWRRAGESLGPKPPSRKIRETRVTCLACGHVWYYGKAEALESAGAALQNAGKSMMCCTGCVPAVFIPDAKVVDVAKCQKCNSRAVTKEIVEHEVP